METIIDRLIAAAGRYVGPGDGTESGPFTGELLIRSLLGDMGAEVIYTATAVDGTVQHREHTVVAFDMWSGVVTLYVLCSELNGMGQLGQLGESTFGNGAGLEGFDLQIEILIDPDTEDPGTQNSGTDEQGETTDGDDTAHAITYVWSWGAPGTELSEQSRATMTAAPVSSP